MDQIEEMLRISPPSYALENVSTSVFKEAEKMLIYIGFCSDKMASPLGNKPKIVHLPLNTVLFVSTKKVYLKFSPLISDLYPN